MLALSYINKEEPMAENPIDYPVKLKIDYPDRELNRVMSFFRIFMIIPIVIILCLLTGPGASWREHANAIGWTMGTASGTGIIFFATIIMILFQQKYPKWWFDWNLNLTKFGYRVLSYLSLFTDVYPSTDEEQSVHIEIAYPDAKTELKSWFPLVKWFLAIPHYIILGFLSVAAAICVLFAWFAILFTGKYPRGLFVFVLGVYRWDLRVFAYAFMLVTDKYPPFGLE